MSTPVATIADALIAFILSLLRDPAAAEQFNSQPQEMLAGNGLQDVCAADVAAVKPVIIDHPHVHPKPPGPPPPEPPDVVTKEIARIVNQFTTIENRPTIIDQSTNQNIWTNGGDVTQIFDQEAVVAVGDKSVAAGDDATTIDSDVDVTIGDVAIGNEHHTDSHNVDASDNIDATNNSGTIVTDAGDESAAATADATAETSTTESGDASGVVQTAGDAVAGAVDTAVNIAESVSQPAPAPVEDPLAADLTATDSYEADSSAAPVDETYIEEPMEED